MDIIFWAANAAISVVSIKVCSRAVSVERREIAVLRATLINETPIVAIITRIMILV